MVEMIPYALWLLGPLLIAWLIGKRLLGASWIVFFIGIPTFICAWLMSVVTSGVLAAASVAPSSFAFGLCISLSAGVSEESVRYLAFRFIGPMRCRLDWNHGLMYTFGHAGIESVIEGLTFLFMIGLLVWIPDQLDAETTAACLAAKNATIGTLLFTATTRIVLGPLIHGSWTCLIVMAVRDKRLSLYLLAISWHFAHNVIGFNVTRMLGGSGAYFWIGLIAVLYPVFIWKMRAALKPASQVGADPAGGASG
jgi:uncharacterized membrane protein YhfC